MIGDEKKIIINATQQFEKVGGAYNQAIALQNVETCTRFDNLNIKISYIQRGDHIEEEVLKFIWLDYSIYHISICWFQIFHYLRNIVEFFSA